MVTVAVVLFIIGGLVLMVVGGVIYEDNPSFIIGLVMSISGVVIGIIIVNKKNKDRERRTTTVTEVVVETRQTWTKEDGCVQAFKLKNVPFTLETECASFVKYSYSPPKEGDVMKVKFIRSKKPEGKPEVLEVQNLTQEIERARSASPPAPEAPPQ